MEYLEQHAPYDNYTVDPKTITDATEQLPALRPLSEEAYQEISELTNLDSTVLLLKRLEEEVQNNEEIDENARTQCQNLLGAMERRIEETNIQYTSVQKAKDDIYRESVRCLVKKSDTTENAELQAQIKEQMEVNQRLESQLLKVQDTFCKTKGGVENLATVLYEKLSAQTLNGSMSGQLLVSTDKKEKGKGFKSMFVILKDNFVFIFKSASDSSPVDVLLLTRPASAVDNGRFGKENAFIMEGRAFAATSEQQRDEWLQATRCAKRWFETSTTINE